MNKKHTWNLLYWFLALILFVYIQDVWQSANQAQVVSYSEFEKSIGNHLFSEVTIAGNTITGKLKTPDGAKTVMVATIVDPALAARLDKFDVPYTRIIENTFLHDLVVGLAPFLLIFALWFFLFRNFAEKQGMGGFLSIGKSNAKVYIQTNTGVTFADVAGVDEAKSELEEVVDFLKRPQEYGRLGAHIPKGVLLVGPPGTGKTLLAKAVAGEAGVPFFSISGSEFVEMFVGVGAARVRDLFEQARTHAPAIIFIDELDALGRARGAMSPLGGHDEKEQTLNQLLSEMDGFDSSGGLIILSATNRPEILDPALLRAGRFDRQVLVDRPDRQGRIAILKVHVAKIKLDPAVDLDTIAGLTPGFSGADLANLVNEATLVATRQRAEQVTEANFTSAVERIVAGLEHKTRLMSTRERETVACHEMGHVLVALALKHVDPVHKVSIIPRGFGALGYTIQRPSEDRHLSSKHELEEKIAVLLAGRAAEKLMLGVLSTGAADDLVKASDLARHMVTSYGMDEDLGYVAFDLEQRSMLDTSGATTSGNINASEDVLRRIDAAIRTIVMDAYHRAYAILSTNREVLDRGARLLLQKETLDEAAIHTLAHDLVIDAGSS
ncbi:ATP-dependent zinc metalloprotease FtsH [Undibacterium sp. TS12]|uniref:ATP-dependent zinc metalloprotease FtsH n=1 Tax=Undibacterium sp. TS12 TaxID=2908202 RepID=UPI001F4CB061|nr:ATP-dependent zinc metalloprotease FtsH [Undibacterium sp. TS12]MCH8622477.1 ATP-dependent zinc metalloprotease FtsH [Undibacterium sp. TS12]